MRLDEMKLKLSNCADGLPYAAMKAAIADRERATPILQGMIEEAQVFFDEFSREPSYFGVVPAMYLLAQFRDRESFSLVADLFTWHSEAFDVWLPDFVTEELPAILASLCGSDLAVLDTL